MEKYTLVTNLKNVILFWLVLAKTGFKTRFMTKIIEILANYIKPPLDFYVLDKIINYESPPKTPNLLKNRFF